MYQDYFQLAERPFTTTPYAPHYCPIRYFDQALNTTRHAISEATGPAMVIGSAGIGKSMFLEVLAEKYRGFFKIACLNCSPEATRAEMLQQILFELDRPYQGMNEGELRLSLLEYLKAGEKCPNGALILADDAHMLSPELLAELNAISNLVRDGIPRVRLVLAGKPRLEETLTLPSLDSLAQRIAARCYLQAMTREQTKSYIDQHLLRTGRSSTEVFEPNAIELIAEITQGIPRIVNQICCHAMILTADNCSPTVTESVVADAWHDIQQLPGSLTSHHSIVASDRDVHDLDSLPDNAQFENVGVVEFGSFDETPINAQMADENTKLPSPVAETVPTENIQEDALAIAANLDSELVDRPKLFVKFGDEDSGEPNKSTGAAIEQPTSSTSTTIETQSANPPNLKPRRTTDESVFGTDFDQEEVVADPFSQWAAQQNRSSLDVTDSELADLMAHAEEIKKQLAAHEICAAEPEVLLPGDSAEISATAQTDCEQGDQATVGRIAESISLQELSRLKNNTQEQTSITVESSHDSPTEDSVSAVDTSAQLDAINKENTIASKTAIDDSNDQSTFSEYPLHEHDAYLNPAMQVQTQDSTLTPTSETDDRDILLVSHRNRNETNARVDENEDSVGAPSRGHAKRMDYRDLFEMLREPTQS